MLPDGLAAAVSAGSWPVLPIFEYLRKIGQVPENDWRRSFNLGIGLIVAIGRKDVQQAEKILSKLREPFFPMGRIIEQEAGGPRVVYR